MFFSLDLKHSYLLCPRYYARLKGNKLNEIASTLQLLTVKGDRIKN